MADDADAERDPSTCWMDSHLGDPAEWLEMAGLQELI